MSAPRFHVVIPARFGSSRLPGKPLVQLAGKPMIQHVWERARESGAERVVVATDDRRILAVVQEFGGEAVMTRPDHLSGSDRIAEVADLLGWDDDALVVNLQGDEPLMPPQLVHAVARTLTAHAGGMATVALRVREAAEIFDSNVVKVVCNHAGDALYFSRAPIPWVRSAYMHGAPLPALPEAPVLRHLGLYAYDAGTLRRITRLAPTPLELAESLEQLRALQHGIPIRVFVSDLCRIPRGVDTEQDALEADRELRQRDM